MKTNDKKWKLRGGPNFLLPLTIKSIFQTFSSICESPINVITLYDKVWVRCVRVWCVGWSLPRPPCVNNEEEVTEQLHTTEIVCWYPLLVLVLVLPFLIPLPSSTSYYVIHVFLPLILKGILPQSALRVNYWPNALWKITVIIDSWSATPEKKSVSIEHTTLLSPSL